MKVSPASKTLNVRIEAEDHSAPFPNRFKFTISSFRIDCLLPNRGTGLKRILEDDMCSNETFCFCRYLPSSRVGRSPACGKVDRVDIGAVGLQLECLRAAGPFGFPSP